ncbi:MAG: hypothetical protein E4H47_01535 [Parcubacteria group bacterium]|nr:MAG: hypothetical protein E4H47_01535 [Parcubacteria group bacterium]
MIDIPLLSLLIVNAARIVAFSYLMGYLYIDVMSFEGSLTIIILLLAIFILVMILLIRELRMKYK